MSRQGERLAPQFVALQQALAKEAATLTDATDVSDPEYLVVFEIVGAVPGFLRATQGVEGLNFVDDIVGSGIDPDEDFYYLDTDREPSDKKLPQTLYLVMANARAVNELVRLFELYKQDQDIKFDRGLAPLKKVFELLHAVRRWGSEDRVAETGLLDRWQPLSTPLYVYPVLLPDGSPAGWETTPRGQLLVDVIHIAFQRLVAKDNQAGKLVRIVNLSIGEPARVFIRRMSPLARLIDYLMVTHNILVIVSAGNHPIARSGEAGIKLTVPRSVLVGEPENLDQAVRASWFRTARQRGLLAPAESINAITVGAIHGDGASGDIPDTVIDPLSKGSIAVYSPSGFGYRSSPKPELHTLGGRALVFRPTDQDDGTEEVILKRVKTQVLGPGIRVAAPGDGLGTSNFAYTYGTSNAAALTTRAAAQIEEELRRLELESDEWDFPCSEYHPVLIKTLLVHASCWPDEAWQWAEQLNISGAHRRRDLTQMLGFGVLDPQRAVAASRTRACVIGAGAIEKDQRRSFRFPLPPSLSIYVGWRRLIATLAWFSPIMPRTQQYRVVQLSFRSPRDQLKVKPAQVDRYANGKGTVLHEVLVGKRAAGYMVEDELVIDVDCRVRVGKLNEPVRFGLAATLEVGQDVDIDVHDEIRQKLRAQATATRVQATARS